MALFGFFIFLAVWMYCSHLQFMAGYSNTFFEWKTNEEKRLRAKLLRDADS